jgi:SHS2 domain-containing protein
MAHKINELPPVQQWANDTDLKLLKQQKLALLEVIEDTDDVPKLEAMEGIVAWIDSFQDMMVDKYNVNPVLVYGFDE